MERGLRGLHIFPELVLTRIYAASLVVLVHMALLEFMVLRNHAKDTMMALDR